MHSFDRKHDAVTTVPFDRTRQPLPDGLLEQALRTGEAVADIDDAGRRVSVFPMSWLNEFSICLAFAFEGEEANESLDGLLVQSFFSVYRNFVRLIDDAQTDELTGLLNRKTFDDNFRELATLERNVHRPVLAEDRRQEPNPDETQIWLGVIDIDDFKKINDSFGHMYGDEVLILLARLLQQSFREHDLIYRFGGEEFVVLADMAAATFERLQRAVADYTLPRVGRVTTSIGVTQLRPYKTASAVLDEADQALYYAKANGKNQVCLYDRLFAAGSIQRFAIQTGEIEWF